MEQEIITKLKEKKLSDNSIKLYMTILKNLNDKREIRNFKFLEKPKKILEKIKDYKLTTQRNILIAIVSVLKNLGNDLYKSYYDLMIEYNKKIEDGNKNNEKTETQKNNWMEFKDVENKFNELKSKLKGSSNISEDMYNNYLNAVVLGLYVLTPPRRSKDYTLMKVSKDSKGLDDKYNWLDLKKKQFIFNNYKTEKTYGQQIVDVPTELFELIKKYLKYKKDGEGFLLVKFNGEKLKQDNSITRLLNKIFGKRISSSMLRHIYLTNRFKDVNKEMQDTALKMGHSVFQQKDYIKND